MHSPIESRKADQFGKEEVVGNAAMPDFLPVFRVGRNAVGVQYHDDTTALGRLWFPAGSAARRGLSLRSFGRRSFAAARSKMIVHVLMEIVHIATGARKYRLMRAFVKMFVSERTILGARGDNFVEFRLVLLAVLGFWLLFSHFQLSLPASSPGSGRSTEGADAGFSTRGKKT